jgi:hypothetical protein
MLNDLCHVNYLISSFLFQNPLIKCVVFLTLDLCHRQNGRLISDLAHLKEILSNVARNFDLLLPQFDRLGVVQDRNYLY